MRVRRGAERRAPQGSVGPEGEAARRSRSTRDSNRRRGVAQRGCGPGPVSTTTGMRRRECRDVAALRRWFGVVAERSRARPRVVLVHRAKPFVRRTSRDVAISVPVRRVAQRARAPSSTGQHEIRRNESAGGQGQSMLTAEHGRPRSRKVRERMITYGKIPERESFRSKRRCEWNASIERHARARPSEQSLRQCVADGSQQLGHRDLRRHRDDERQANPERHRQ